MIKLLDILKEVDYSLHVNTHNELDINKLKKYGGGTDSLIKMRGRGTGHFGSGTYLSTYKIESDFNIDTPKVKDTLYKNYGKPLIKIDGGTYAIDLDRYNLFKPKNEKHAELLFNLLKNINNLFYSMQYDEDRQLKKEYLTEILDSCKILNLRFTKKFVKKIKNEVLPNYSKNSGGGPDLKYKASVSTMFMEDNGFNGVNVNGIRMFDNTRHGSVIYDLNDVTDTPKSTPSYHEKSSYEPESISDFVEKINEYSFSTADIRELSNSEINRILKLINYNKLDYYQYHSGFEFMDEYNKIYPNQIELIKKVYPNIIFKKIRELDFEREKIDDNIYGFLIMYLEKNTNDYDKKYLNYLSQNYYGKKFKLPNNYKSILNKYLDSLDYESLDRYEKSDYDNLKEELEY
jgi:hypothetical protein